MTVPLILFLAAAVIPVFFGRIRAAPLWLAVQGLALAWAALGRQAAIDAHALFVLAELILVRAVIAPWLLARAIRLRDESNRELMPSNLFFWGIGIALIVVAFQFGAPESGGRDALTLGVVGATVAVTLLVLAANESPPAQLVALLFTENAIALFETLLVEPWPLTIHAALSTIFLLTVAVGAWLIGVMPEDRGAEPASGGKGDT